MNTIKVNYKTVHPLRGLFDETKTTQLKVADALGQCMVRNSIFQKYKEDKDARQKPRQITSRLVNSSSAGKFRKNRSDKNIAGSSIKAHEKKVTKICPISSTAKNQPRNLVIYHKTEKGEPIEDRIRPKNETYRFGATGHTRKIDLSEQLRLACIELEQLNQKSTNSTNELLRRQNLVKNKDKIAQDLADLKQKIAQSNATSEYYQHEIEGFEAEEKLIQDAIFQINQLIQGEQEKCQTDVKRHLEPDIERFTKKSKCLQEEIESLKIQREDLLGGITQHNQNGQPNSVLRRGSAQSLGSISKMQQSKSQEKRVAFAMNSSPMFKEKQVTASTQEKSLRRPSSAKSSLKFAQQDQGDEATLKKDLKKATELYYEVKDRLTTNNAKASLNLQKMEFDLKNRLEQDIYFLEKAIKRGEEELGKLTKVKKEKEQERNKMQLSIKTQDHKALTAKKSFQEWRQSPVDPEIDLFEKNLQTIHQKTKQKRSLRKEDQYGQEQDEGKQRYRASKDRDIKIERFVDSVTQNFDNLSTELEGIWTSSARLENQVLLKRLASFLDKLELSIKDIDLVQNQCKSKKIF